MFSQKFALFAESALDTTDIGLDGIKSGSRFCLQRIDLLTEQQTFAYDVLRFGIVIGPERVSHWEVTYQHAARPTTESDRTD